MKALTLKTTKPEYIRRIMLDMIGKCEHIIS